MPNLATTLTLAFASAPFSPAPHPPRPIAGTHPSRRQSLWLGAGAALGLLAPTAQAATPASAAELAPLLEQLLKQHPEWVRNALAELDRREAAAKAAQEQAALARSMPAILATTGATVLGNPKGDVTLVAFSDYRCGYCKRLAASVDELLASDRGLRVLVKHLPILGPESLAAARLAVSVPAGPAAVRLHQQLLAAEQLDAAALKSLAQGTRVTLLDDATANRALDDVRLLAGRLGIQGTPALVIGQSLQRGALETPALADLVRRARLTPPQGGKHA